MTGKIQELRVDRTAFSVVSLHDEDSDLQYWLSRTPEERLEALEIMRQIVFGYDSETARIEKVIEILSLKDLK